MVKKRSVISKLSKKYKVSNRLSYTIIAVVALILVGAGVYAAVDKTQPWHPSSTVEVSVGGVAKSLQEAINAADFSLWETITEGIAYSAGNVGIGTNTPASKLTVVGDIALNGKIKGYGNIPSSSTTYTGNCLEGYMMYDEYTEREYLVDGYFNSAQECSAGASETTVEGNCDVNADGNIGSDEIYVQSRTCSFPAQEGYYDRVSFDFYGTNFSGKIRGDSSGTSPFITGTVTGSVGCLPGADHDVGSLPAGVDGSRCVTFLSSAQAEFGGSGNQPFFGAGCNLGGAGDTMVHGAICQDLIAQTDGTVSCSYLCW